MMQLTNPKPRNRIPRMVKKLLKIWKKYPNLRFGQLIVYLSRNVETDIFFIEDTEWEKFLDEGPK